MTEPEAPEPHYHGHRQRLRERLLRSGPDSLQDYELLELLLFAAVPRKDVKPLAKSLLARFKGLWAIINAPVETLIQFGLSECAATTLSVAGAIALRANKKEIISGPFLNNWQKLVDYCRMAMAHEKIEQFRLVFLDRRNRVLLDEVHQHGTIDHTPVYPREVVKRALEIGAGALVLVHNHPSGDPTPSKDDVAMTKAIIEACRPLGIAVHDHIIVGREGVVSLKNLGLM
ncbi:MAG: DNA repair protein RadC [Alphaproteobacteria bacterium]|nr:DNA repair protein RadC [Alphaproteobacteria bacterium]